MLPTAKISYFQSKSKFNVACKEMKKKKKNREWNF